MQPAIGAIRKSGPSAKPQQKVILVQKRPAKAIRIESDDDDNYVESRSADKCVSFSEEDEVLLIAARKTPPKPKPKIAATNESTNIRNRLGKSHLYTFFLCLTLKWLPGFTAKPTSNDLLHRTRKTVPLKASPSKSRTGLMPIIQKSSLLRSDNVLRNASRPTSVKSRLSINRKISYSAGPPLKNRSTATENNRRSEAVASVFQRLGFNDSH